MNLKDRILSHGISVQILATQIGINRAHLHTLLTGWRGRRPSVTLAKKIEETTNGLIRWTEFYEDVQPAENSKG